MSTTTTTTTITAAETLREELTSRHGFTGVTVTEGEGGTVTVRMPGFNLARTVVDRIAASRTPRLPADDAPMGRVDALARDLADVGVIAAVATQRDRDSLWVTLTLNGPSAATTARLLAAQLVPGHLVAAPVAAMHRLRPAVLPERVALDRLTAALADVGVRVDQTQVMGGRASLTLLTSDLDRLASLLSLDSAA